MKFDTDIHVAQRGNPNVFLILHHQYDNFLFIYIIILYLIDGLAQNLVICGSKTIYHTDFHDFTTFLLLPLGG